MTSALCREVAQTRLGSESYRQAIGCLDGRNMPPQESAIRSLLAGHLTAEDLPALRSIWSQAHHRMDRFLRRLDCRAALEVPMAPERRETVLRLAGGSTPLLDALQQLTGREGRQAMRGLLSSGGSEEALLAASQIDGQMGDLRYALDCLPEIAAQQATLQVVNRSQIFRLQDLLWVAGLILPPNGTFATAQRVVDGMLP